MSPERFLRPLLSLALAGGVIATVHANPTAGSDLYRERPIRPVLAPSCLI